MVDVTSFEVTSTQVMIFSVKHPAQNTGPAHAPEPHRG
jgi:hypothetical protein